MYTHMLLLALVGEPTCPEVLVPVCRELAADRPLAAAELAAPVARDPSVAPQDRRAATAFAVGAWVREGSPAARCKAKALLAEYFAEPGLPRTSALERRRSELAADHCEPEPTPDSRRPSASSPPTPSAEPPTSAATTTTQPPPPPPVTRPPPATMTPVTSPSRPTRAARLSDRGRLALGGTLVGVGVGLGALTIGYLGLFGHEVSFGRGLLARAEQEHRDLTPVEWQQFNDAVAIASQARWVALGVGLAGAATLGAGIPLVISARRAMRLRPYMRGGAAGIIFSGAF